MAIAAAMARTADLTAANAPVLVSVDGARARHPISPLIYGVAHATAGELAELNAPLNRLGGNHASRYNWTSNAYNRAHDWFFESVAEPGSTPGAAADAFVRDTRAAGGEALLTVPAIGWVARLGPERTRLASFSVARYGAQSKTDTRWFPDAGNGIRTDGTPVAGNDPRDANAPSDPAFQQDWLRHLVSTWGTSKAGGVRYYAIDNEPSLWHATHRDVHSSGATMDEVREKVIAYASAIKAVDPGVRVLAPEEWGWPGYFHSGADQQWAARRGWAGPLPDRARHDGWDYLPWLLDQWRRHEAATGVRPVDVVSLHYYPQGGEYGDDVSPAMQRRRTRSTRSLWDPHYVDESWVASRVALIPRLREWVDRHYLPGTPIAITEYSWGAETHISGALAQADALGIFGREGLDMAVRWATPDASTPTFKAMKLFRNYDGQRSAFGDVSISATVPNPDEVAAYAAERSTDGATTIVVISKHLAGTTPVTVRLSHLRHGGRAACWQLGASGRLERKPDVEIGHDELRATVPPQSVTLLAIGR